MELRPGVRIDRYTLVEPLGEGGQGAVWKAIDPLDGGALRAIKLIPLDSDRAAPSERARRESRAIAGASHPSLVRCHSLFEDLETKLIGLVFDLVPGSTLVAAARDPRLTPAHKSAALEQVALALAHVHALGIVHRDLKPANILLTETFWAAPSAPGGVKLVDFGIATAAGNPRPLTAVGAVAGTLPYMAPELLLPGRWTPARDGFGRDVFAFGVLAWELLEGSHPAGGAPGVFEAEDYAAVYEAAADDRSRWPPRRAAGPWGPAIDACLALDPLRRPATGVVLVELLRSLGLALGSNPSLPSAAEAPAGNTAPHQPATGSGSTPMLLDSLPAHPQHAPSRRASSNARPPASTEPMRAPPTGAVSPPRGTFADNAPAPGGYPYPRVPLPAARSNAGCLVGISLAIVGVVALCASIYVLLRSPREEAPPFVLPTTRAPAPVNPPVPVVTPAPELPTPTRCCSDGSPCKSGRTCTERGCVALPQRAWRLRMTGLTGRVGDKYSEDMAGTHPRATVCLRRAGTAEPEACASLKDIAVRGGDRVNRLWVETTDLVRGNIEVRVLEDSEALHQGRSPSNLEGISSSVLCKGLFLYTGPRDSAPSRLSVDLDDP